MQPDGLGAKPATVADPLAARKTIVDPARPSAADAPRLPLPGSAPTQPENPASAIDVSGRSGSVLVNVHSEMSNLNTEQYLAKTRKEVDAGLVDLTQQVTELEARLYKARAGMVRLKAIKDALQTDHRGNLPSRVMPPSTISVAPPLPSSTLETVTSMVPVTTVRLRGVDPIPPPEPLTEPTPPSPLLPSDPPLPPARGEIPLPPAHTEIIPPPQATVVLPSPIIGHAPASSPMPPVQPGQTIRLEVLEALTARPLTGLRVVRKDGTVNLEYYGELYVAGLNRKQVKEKLITHMRQYLSDNALGLVEPDPVDPKKMRPASGGIEMNSVVYVDDQPGDDNVSATRRVEELERKFQNLFQLMSTQKPAETKPQAQPTPVPAPQPAPRL